MGSGAVRALQKSQNRLSKKFVFSQWESHIFVYIKNSPIPEVLQTHVSKDILKIWGI